MQVNLELSDEQDKQLRQLAESSGIETADVIRVAVTDFLSRSGEFDQAVQYVLEKNRELYQRLS